MTSPIATFVDKVLVEADPVVPTILVGPVVWQLDEHGERRWYCGVASGGPGGFFADAIGAEDRACTETFRSALIAELRHRPPIVIHDFDCELEMARWAAAIWPCTQTNALRAVVEAERALTVH